jgi:hypothetical protein
MALLNGVPECDQETLQTLMRFSIVGGTNLMVFGSAGIGKTEMGFQSCASNIRPVELGEIENQGKDDGKGAYDYIYLNLSVLEAPDLMGLPRLTEDGKKSTYALPEKFPLFGEDRPKVLIVDELDKAKPELQNPMLELFQFRSVNGTRLNIQSVIATGNLPDENAFSQPLSHALMNRCMVYRVTHSFDAWQKWAAGKVHPLIVGFLSRNTDYLLKKAPSGDDTAYCHPSPRSWTLAGQDLDMASAVAPVEFQSLLVSGRVGQEASVKFRVWLDHYRHISPVIDSIVRDGKIPSSDQLNSIDRIFVCAIAGSDAIMEACRKAGSAKNQSAAHQEVHKVTDNVMRWMGTLPSEIAIGSVKSVLNMDMITKYQLMKVKSFMDVYLKIRKAMNKE